MRRIRWVPGNIVAGNDIAIPAYAPNIDVVLGAQITRIPNSFALAHVDSGVAVPHADGVDVGHLNMAVNPHAPHAHDLVSQGIGAPPVFAVIGYTFPPGPPPTQLQDDQPAGAHTLGGGLATGIQDFLGAAIPHGVTQPDDHLAGDIAVALIHDPADISAALLDHAPSGVSPVVVPTVTPISARIIQLDVDTLLGDLLTLAYFEVGERVPVS